MQSEAGYATESTAEISRLQTRCFLTAFILCLAGGAIGMYHWFTTDPTAAFSEKIPGMCGEPSGDKSSPTSRNDTVAIGSFFERFDSGPVSGSGSWPRFRGAHSDNMVKHTPPLRATWNGNPPDVRWSVNLGEGHAAPAIFNGRVYVLDYNEELSADMLRCFSFENGSELWRRWYTVKVKRNHGMSRTIPAVTDSFCVTIGPRCHVMCVDPLTGLLRWGIDLEREFDTEVPLWYTGQCPLIDDTVAVIAPGGSSLIVGINCFTGAILWKTPNPSGWKMSHSSVMPMQVAGRRMYVYCAVGGVCGVAADGDDRGTVLFASDCFNKTVVAPSPVRLDGNRILLTAGYGAGSMIVRITASAGSFSVHVENETGVKEGFASEQQTPIFYKGYLYGIMPKDAGPLRNQLVCVHPDAPDRPVWTSGTEKRFGLGPYLIADGKLFVFNEDGLLTTFSATSRSCNELGSVQLMDAVDAWGPMALVDGYLLVRDTGKMLCVDIRNILQ